MAFQGFAREEQFSTNQINIDINSVINSDLAEANRMSKFMAKNASMQERWGTMYLNALVGKHEAEKRNREENFKLFMDNREKIQNQIKYNNEIKFQDAGRETPAPLMETLGPEIMEFAVKVGAHYISQAVEQGKEDKIEAEKKKHQESVGAWNSISGEMRTPEKQKSMNTMLDSWKDLTLQQQDEIFNASPFANHAYITIKSIGQASGLTRLQREQIQYSPTNISQDIQAYARGPGGTIPINGRDFTLATITQTSVNEDTRLAYFDTLKSRYYKDRIPTSLNPQSLGAAQTTWKSVSSQLQHASYNSEIAYAKADEYRRTARETQIRLDSGGVIPAVKFAVKGFNDDGTSIPGSPVHTVGRERAWDRFTKMAENGLFNLEQFQQIMNQKGLMGPGSPSFNEQLASKTPSGRAVEFGRIRDNLVLQGHKDIENTQLRVDLAGHEFELQIPDMDKQTARAHYHSFENGTHNEMLRSMSAGKQKSIMESLAKQAGITHDVPTLSEGQKHAGKMFNQTTRQSLWEPLLNEDGKTVSLKASLSKHTGKVKAQADSIFEQWVADRIDDIGGNPEDPNVKATILKMLDDPNNESVKKLKERLEVETINPVTKKPYANGPKLKNFQMPEARGNGVAQYLEKRGDFIEDGREINLNDIDYSFINGWVRSVDAALENGNIDQQNVLSRLDPDGLVTTIMKKDSTGTTGPGAIYNAAVKYLNREEGMDYQQLPENQYINQAEYLQLNKRFGNHFKNATNQGLKQVIASGQHTPNAATVRSASGITYSTNVVDTGFKDYKGRNIMLSPQATVSWQAMIDAGMPFNSKSVHSVYRDEAEVKRLWSQGIDASATGAHNRGEAMDVHGDMGAWIKKHGKEFGWGPEDSSYGHGGHGGHFIFKGYNPPQQQTQLLPLTVPVSGLNIPGAELVETRNFGPGTPGYGNTAPIEEEGIDVTNKLLGGADAVLNTLLPGNIFDLDRKGN
jgi:hypothetical protein